MIALLGLALAQESVQCDPAAAIDLVRAGNREAYVCVVETASARDTLLAALDAGGEHPERLTRALALWLLTHEEGAFDAALVRRLSPADRRLLADGVRARRGRKSPVPEHEKAFSNFAWYAPKPGYTDGALRPVDRANIAMADAPPPAPAPPADAPPAADATAPATAAEGTPGKCGCGGSGAAALVLPLLFRRRRC